MRNWRIDQPCFLCGEPDETRDHLFCMPLFVHSLDGCRGIFDWYTGGYGLGCYSESAHYAFIQYRHFPSPSVGVSSADLLHLEKKEERRHKGDCHPTGHLICIIDKTVCNRCSSLRLYFNGGSMIGKFGKSGSSRFIYNFFSIHVDF